MHGEKTMTIMLSRFHNTSVSRTDGWTDRQNCYINIARQHQCVLMRDKKMKIQQHQQPNNTLRTYNQHCSRPSYYLPIFSRQNEYSI